MEGDSSLKGLTESDLIRLSEQKGHLKDALVGIQQKIDSISPSELNPEGHKRALERLMANLGRQARAKKLKQQNR